MNMQKIVVISPNWVDSQSFRIFSRVCLGEKYLSEKWHETKKGWRDLDLIQMTGDKTCGQRQLSEIHWFRLSLQLVC
jgi:hypothetical protein